MRFDPVGPPHHEIAEGREEEVRVEDFPGVSRRPAP